MSESKKITILAMAWVTIMQLLFLSLMVWIFIFEPRYRAKQEDKQIQSTNQPSTPQKPITPL